MSFSPEHNPVSTADLLRQRSDFESAEQPPRVLDARPGYYSADIQRLFAEIITTDQPVNGLQNPIYDQNAGHHYGADFYLEQVAAKTRFAATDAMHAEKTAALAQFQPDAERLAARVQEFGAEFRAQFEATALYDRNQPFTAQLVFELREFLLDRMPTWFPIWDKNPFTQYSGEQQVMNFLQRTMQHIDCLLLYTNEYFTGWNKLVDGHAQSPEAAEQLRVDVYQMMCRALLHDLGRWFTQDARAHEEIPASFAEVLTADGTVISPGLRRDLLTVGSTDPAEHPRGFDLRNKISMKVLVRVIEFFADFNSKPHEDYVWSYTIPILAELQALMQEEARLENEGMSLDENEKQRLEALIEVANRLEHLRTRNLRHPKFAFMYFLYSGRGYKHTTEADMPQWREILETELAHNPDKLEYLITEARMLEQGQAFLVSLGLSPEEIRSRVMANWQAVDLNDTRFMEKCFPQMLAEIEAAKAVAQA